MSNVFAALRALIDALQARTGAGGDLEGVQVAYAMRAAILQPQAVYGGRVRFTRPPEEAVTDGEADELASEAGTVDLYVRVRLPLADLPPDVTDPVDAADRRATEIGAVVKTVIGRNRRLAGPLTYMRIAAGNREYVDDDESVTASLMYTITVDSLS